MENTKLKKNLKQKINENLTCSIVFESQTFRFSRFVPPENVKMNVDDRKCENKSIQKKQEHESKLRRRRFSERLFTFEGKDFSTSFLILRKRNGSNSRWRFW